MSSIGHSATFIRKRKFLLVLPVLILPFVIILFCLMGGGGKGPSFTGEKQTGLNLQLPDAHFLKKKEPDKLALYEESKKDSDKLRLALRNDPYRSDSLKPAEHHLEKANALQSIFEKAAAPFPGKDLEDLPLNSSFGAGQSSGAAKEQELMDNLKKLKEQLNFQAGSKHDEKKDKPDIPKSGHSDRDYLHAGDTGPANKINVDQETDPEMIQLNKMLDKVMAIQHPEKFSDSLTKKSSDQNMRAFRVTLNKGSKDAELFGMPAQKEDSAEPDTENRFYDPEADPQMDSSEDHAIRAIIPETQTLVSGSSIKLQLQDDIRIAGYPVPKNQFIYGVCSMNNERLKIQFSSIRCGNIILPVYLQAYDLDGLAGIYIPGSMNREAVKQSGDQAINSLGLTTLDPSIGAQAASAGIQTAKTLLSRKVRLVKVTVRAGYQVLLKDDRK